MADGLSDHGRTNGSGSAGLTPAPTGAAASTCGACARLHRPL